MISAVLWLLNDMLSVSKNLESNCQNWESHLKLNVHVLRSVLDPEPFAANGNLVFQSVFLNNFFQILPCSWKIILQSQGKLNVSSSFSNFFLFYDFDPWSVLYLYRKYPSPYNWAFSPLPIWRNIFNFYNIILCNPITGTLCVDPGPD